MVNYEKRIHVFKISGLTAIVVARDEEDALAILRVRKPDAFARMDAAGKKQERSLFSCPVRRGFTETIETKEGE